LAGSKFDAPDIAASRLASQSVISSASVGSTLDSELMIGSMMMSSIPSALAGGMCSNGPKLNVINALLAPLRPMTRPTLRSNAWRERCFFTRR
jgi:hypothetical protein